MKEGDADTDIPTIPGITAPTRCQQPPIRAESNNGYHTGGMTLECLSERLAASSVSSDVFGKQRPTFRDEDLVEHIIHQVRRCVVYYRHLI